MADTKKATKDLPSKTSSIKAGGRHLNDNLTLVRAAKPAKKDLPAGKDIRAGAGKKKADKKH